VIVLQRSLRLLSAPLLYWPLSRFVPKQTSRCSHSLYDLCLISHYLGLESLLTECLDVYGDFFALFESFRGYVEHFLLQDLVDDTFTSIRFLHGSGDFSEDPLPASGVDDYREYMIQSMSFIRDRNQRIAAYADAHLG
jgi:hypothetical protein